MSKWISEAGNKESEGGEKKTAGYRVLTSEYLIRAESRPDIMQKLPDLMGLPEVQYDKMCRRLVHRFARYVQEFPETQNSYYPQKGGMLDYALNRANIALGLVKGYFLPGADSSRLTPAQVLWAYAVFSASLLHDIGKLATDIEVRLYDKKGNFIKKWDPFAGPMPKDDIYKYEFTSTYMEGFRQHATILLARQLMPEEGFQWIASNKELLSIWLTLLHEQGRRHGTLGPILYRADAMAIQKFLDDYLKQHAKTDYRGFVDKFAHALQRTTGLHGGVEPGDKTIGSGLAFLQWVQEGLEKGEFKQEDGFDIGEDDIALEDKLFKDFVEKTESRKSWQQVKESFINIEQHQISDSAGVSQEVVRRDEASHRHGVKLSNVYLLFPGGINAETLRNIPQLQNFVSQGAISPSGRLVDETPPVQQILEQQQLSQDQPLNPEPDPRKL